MSERNTQQLLRQLQETTALAEQTSDAFERQQEALRQARLELARAADSVTHTDAPLNRMESSWAWFQSKLWGNAAPTQQAHRRVLQSEQTLQQQAQAAYAEIQALPPLGPPAPSMPMSASEETPLMQQRQYVQAQDTELEETRQLMHRLKKQGLLLNAQLSEDKQRRELIDEEITPVEVHMKQNMSIMDRLIEAVWAKWW